jgi:prepilin-type N-terminal cleavage/methylation domain-containing protein
MRFQIKPSSSNCERSSAGHPVEPVARLRVQREKGGFTFMEVLIALIIVAVVFGSIINGYLVSSVRGQWTGYSLAAQSLSLQIIEQARSAVWDGGSGNNEVTNLTLFGRSGDGVSTPLTGYTTNILDVPWKGTNAVPATNYVTIRKFSEDNNATAGWPQVQMIRVDTVWPFTGWGNFSVKYYTNTVCTYIAPDNRDPKDLGATPPPGT